MLSKRRLAIHLVALTTSLLAVRAAGAEATSPAIEITPVQKEPDRVTPLKAPSPYYPVAITINPLSFLRTRFSANVEVMLAQHHGLMVSGFFQTYDTNLLLWKQQSSAFGGEVSYHYFTGTRGADGFFFGPSLLVGREIAKREDPETIEDTKVVALGGAFDIGGQLVHRSGFTIGGGGGIGYLSALTGNGALADALAADRLMPRLNFQIGWSF